MKEQPQPLFSLEDSDLAAIRWSSSGEGYARTRLPVQGWDRAGSGVVWAHRVVLGRIIGRRPTSSEYSDHINGDRLDNRRENIRLAGPRGNSQNRRVISASGFLGVTQHKGGKWQASLKDHGRSIYLGLFDTPEEAAAVAAGERRRRGFLERSGPDRAPHRADLRGRAIEARRTRAPQGETTP